MRAMNLSSIAELLDWFDRATTYECVECQQTIRAITERTFDPRRGIVEQICFSCDHWSRLLACTDASHLVIVSTDGTMRHFVDGGPSRSPSSTRGFAGRKFRFRLADGTTIETTNLWGQGIVPDHFRERFLPRLAEALSDEQ